MRRALSTLAAGAVIAAAVMMPALAAERTVTLAVDNLTCVSCPYIVSRALEGVPGVSDAKVSFGEKTATVTFDDEVVSISDLTRATTNAGFPSRPRSE